MYVRKLREDGTELFFHDGTAMWAVTVHAGTTFTAVSPRRLFEERQAADPTGVWNSHYDVAADGRFLMVASDQRAGAVGHPFQVNVVLNWYQELLERVPIP